jgi:hypothetical protein
VDRKKTSQSSNIKYFKLTVHYFFEKVSNKNETHNVSRRNKEGRAIAQAVSRWFSTAAARIRAQRDLWWTKWCWGRFSPSTSVSPAYLHSTNFSVIPLPIFIPPISPSS